MYRSFALWLTLVLCGFAFSGIAAQAGAPDEQTSRAVDDIVKALKSDSVETRNDAVETLSGLDAKALPFLKKQADTAKGSGDFETELRLRQAIERIESAKTSQGEPSNGEPDSPVLEDDEVVLPGLRVRGMRGGNGVTVRSESSINGKRSIVDERNGVRTEFSRDGDGPIKAKVTKDGTTTESSFDSPEQLKEKDPDLYAVWSGEGTGVQLRIFGEGRGMPGEESDPSDGDLDDPFAELERMQRDMEKIREEHDRRVREMLKRFRDIERGVPDEDSDSPKESDSSGRDPAEDLRDFDRELDRILEGILRRRAGIEPGREDGLGGDDELETEPVPSRPRADDTEDRY